MTNTISAADIGKAIQVFRGGQQTFGENSYDTNGYSNQDLIATITNVIGSTAFLSQIVSNTGTLRVTYGTDNTPAFSNCIWAANGTAEVRIDIPDGTYLLLPNMYESDQAYRRAALPLYRGGLHFRGASKEGTILLSRGAWRREPHPTTGVIGSYRGFLWQVVAPITNDLPLIFENMTWDGGVVSGNTTEHSFPVNEVDGEGWDTQHGAYLTHDRGNKSGTATQQVLNNLIVQHWRGEMIKSIDANTNGNITITNCTFTDGNATALNIYPAWNVRGNTFSNLYQIAELYQQYYTNNGYFCNNFATNISANGFAINGGKWASRPFLMQSNVLHLGPGHGVMMQPASNVTIQDNDFYLEDYAQAISVGVIGAQGTECNSNIVIRANRIYAPEKLTRVFGMGDRGINAVLGLIVESNFISAPLQIFDLMTVGREATNLVFRYNTVVSDLVEMRTGVSGATNAPYLWVQPNNSYLAFPRQYLSPRTNIINYIEGPKHRMHHVVTGNVFVLDQSVPTQIPAGAYLQIDNSANRAQGTIRIYASESMSNFITLTNGQSVTFNWSGSTWLVDSSGPKPAPPLNMRSGPGPTN